MADTNNEDVVMLLLKENKKLEGKLEEHTAMINELAGILEKVCKTLHIHNDSMIELSKGIKSNSEAITMLSGIYK